MRLRGKIAVALGAVSLVILAAGIWNCFTVLGKIPSEWMTDPVIGLFYSLAFLVVVIAVMRYFLLAILGIWAVYGAALLALWAVSEFRGRGAPK